MDHVAHLKPSDGGSAATQCKDYTLKASHQTKPWGVASLWLCFLNIISHTIWGIFLDRIVLIDAFVQWLLILQEYTVPSRCSIAGSVLSISILLPCKKVRTYMKCYIALSLATEIMLYRACSPKHASIHLNLNRTLISQTYWRSCWTFGLRNLTAKPFLQLRVTFQWIIRCLGKSQAS